MSEYDGFRVLSRERVWMIGAVVLAACALTVWAGIEWIEAYGEDLSIRSAISQADATAKLAGDLRTLSWACLVGLLTVSATLLWYAWRALRARSMPPPKAWIVAGQRIRTGREAVVAAWVVMVCAAALGACAILAWRSLWALAGSIEA